MAGRSLTLSEFYDAKFQSLFLCDVRPRTFEAYREAVDRWKEKTGDPPLAKISSETMARFKAALRVDDRSPETCNKILRHVNAVISKCGPAGPRNREALGIIDRIPWTKPFRCERNLPRLVELETVAAIIRGCVGARFPKIDCRPSAWWRALILLAVTSGFRRGALLSLTWPHIDVGRRIVRLPACFDKKGREREKPLHDQIVKLLLEIRGPQEKVFAWPHCRKVWYKTWHAIQDAGDVMEHIRFHDLKRVAGVMFSATGSPWVVQHMLDHASIETSRHYINPMEACREAVDKLPLQKIFAWEPEKVPEGGDRTKTEYKR
jgi:integrase